MDIEVEEVIADPKYGQLDKDLVNMLEQYEYKYFREDKEIPFCGLTIYPIAVRDFETFSSCSMCFTLNKNEDPKGVTKSHLDYLVYKLKDEQEGLMWSYKFQKLLELIFHIENGLKCSDCGAIMRYDDEDFINFVESMKQLDDTKISDPDIELPILKCKKCDGQKFTEMIKTSQNKDTKKYSLFVDGHEINKDDFKKLRQIVMYQNFSDYVEDSWVDPDVKRDHDEKLILERKKNDIHASIEKKVVCLSIATNYKYAEIFDMPIRKFNMALSTVDDLINYKIMKQSVMSGFVSLPKGETIEHWIYKPTKDMYGDSYKSTDEIQNSISNL